MTAAKGSIPMTEQKKAPEPDPVPHVRGPATPSPTRLMSGAPGGPDVADPMAVGDDDGGTSTVVVKEAVYEEHDLPGTDRKGVRLLYAKGQRVPIAELRKLKVQAAESKESSGSAETK